MIASMHIADVGPRWLLRARARSLAPARVPGLEHGELMMGARITARLAPSPLPGRAGLFAVWSSEQALEDFLGDHPLARLLGGGWCLRMQPTRIFGAWPHLSGMPTKELAMDPDEPAAVLTLGKLRLLQTPRFLSASAGAEQLALQDPSLLMASGFASPPRLVATFSLWSSTRGMRAYIEGGAGAGHRDAVRAHAARPFHHASAFLRFRPLAAEGTWEGTDPLAATATTEAPGRA
jgi:hypothetical protein